MIKYYKITQERIDSIVALAGKCSRREIENLTSVNHTTVRHIVNDSLAGHEIRSKIRATKEALDLVRELYPNTAGVEIDRRQGWPIGTANYLAKCYLGLKHTDEFEAELREKSRARCIENFKNADHKAAGRKLKAKRKLEEMRVWEGKPQLTRMKIARIGNRAYSARRRLVREHGYIEDEDNLFTLYYDEDTERRMKKPYDEAYYVERYKFKFEEL